MERTEPEQVPVDVVIVGLGPAGATLANLLGLTGVSTLVLDREGAAYHLPRAVHLDDEVMRVFQTIGIAERFEPYTRVNAGMRFVDADGKLLLDWPRPQEIGPHGWFPSYRFHQPDLETILRDRLADWDCVKVRTRCDVFLVADHGDEVEVRYEDLDTGRLDEVRCRYVVGCDGARSLVRRFVGSGMDDFGFHERWLVVDVLLTRDKPELGDFTIQHCNPARPTTYARGPGHRRRWEITVHDDEDAHAMCAPAMVWELLAGWIGPDEAELERAAVYTFHSAVAERWRAGRLLLAGDAAHLTPPFLGQGMCAGIRDVANLAWKLALVVQGKAGDALLDSYQSERAPNVREYIETAIRLGGLINACATEAALDAAFRQPDGTARMSSITPPLGESLHAGEVGLAGRHFPQPTLSDGRRLDDQVGYRPVLVVATDLWAAAPEELRATCRDSGIAVMESGTEPAAAEILRRLDRAAVLVRPDRYILGAACDGAQLASLVAEALPAPSLQSYPNKEEA